MQKNSERFHFRADRKNESVTLMVTPTEKQHIKNLAKQEKMTISKLLLSSVFSKHGHP